MPYEASEVRPLSIRSLDMGRNPDALRLPLLEKLRQRSPKKDSVRRTVDAVLKLVLDHRRMVRTEDACIDTACDSCAGPHREKVEAAVRELKPISFVLPAFPGKSPNNAKVLGPLPDMAERRALVFLNELCESIREVYAPGARVILCSDGRVFSDVVGMDENNVTAYQDELDSLIDELDLKSITTFNLDNLAGVRSTHACFDGLRSDLMDRYGQDKEVLRAKVRRGASGHGRAEDCDAHRMYCGITRFLFEDAMHPGQTQSRTAVQKQSRAKAYEVIRRSNAWSELIAERFPDAVRLSIHPQVCGSRKMGIQLLGLQTWLTPWHGVAVDVGGGAFSLMKRWEAEKLGFKLVRDSAGRPSHFKVAPEAANGVRAT